MDILDEPGTISGPRENSSQSMGKCLEEFRLRKGRQRSEMSGFYP